MKTKIYVFDDLECEILEIHRLDTYEYYVRYADMTDFCYMFGVKEKFKKSKLRNLIKAEYIGFINAVDHVWEEL